MKAMQDKLKENNDTSGRGEILKKKPRIRLKGRNSDEFRNTDIKKRNRSVLYLIKICYISYVVIK